MAEQEKKQAIETEAARKKLDKDLAAAKVLNDERLHKLAIEEKMREKKLAEERLAEQRRRYELDMRERFGDQWQSKAPKQEVKKAEIEGKELVAHGITLVTTLYTEFRAPGVAQTCIKTCQTLINNLIKDPANEKFRKVNLDNEAIQKRVSKVNGGLQILKGVGFQKAEDGNYLLMTQIDEKLLKEAVQML